MRRLSVCLPAWPALLLSLSLTVAVTGAQADATESELVKQYPAGSIQSVAQANTALAAVTATRKHLENDYTEARSACFEKFFMTNCFDRAKERRRTALSAIRKIEVEASAFLRKDKADERDRGVAERQRKAAASVEGSGIPFTGATRSESGADESVLDKQQDKP